MSKKIQPPFVRNPYNYDTMEASDESGLKCLDPSLAKQEFTEESDINFIAEKFGLTGEMPQVLTLPAYGDFEGIYDFQTAQNTVIQAERQFMTLPAKVRKRFNNDPQELLQFMGKMQEGDQNAIEEAVFLGLAKKAAPDTLGSPQGAAPAKPGGDNPTPPDKTAAAAPPSDKKTP